MNKPFSIEDIRLQQDILARGWTQELPSPIQQHTLSSVAAPSLIQIQQEEAKEMVLLLLLLRTYNITILYLLFRYVNKNFKQ